MLQTIEVTELVQNESLNIKPLQDRLTLNYKKGGLGVTIKESNLRRFNMPLDISVDAKVCGGNNGSHSAKSL